MVSHVCYSLDLVRNQDQCEKGTAAPIASATQGWRPQPKAPFTLSLHKQQVTRTKNDLRDPSVWAKPSIFMVLCLPWSGDLPIFAVEAGTHFQLWFRKTVYWLFYLHPEGKGSCYTNQAQKGLLQGKTKIFSWMLFFTGQKSFHKIFCRRWARKGIAVLKLQ